MQDMRQEEQWECVTSWQLVMMCLAVTRPLRLLPLVYYKEEELEGESW